MRNTVFRYPKNSHSEFIGVLFEGDSGARILDLRLVETDGRGGKKDTGKVVFKLNVENLWIVERICQQARQSAITTEGGR